jgi:hypothetical protein
MGIFEKIGTRVVERRTLFWLVCIVMRLLIATAFTVLSLWWNSWFPFVVGGFGIVGGLGFWIRKYLDPGVWWYRSVHGLLWLGGGLSAILVHHYIQDESATAGSIAAFFYGDVLFGIMTASCSHTSWFKTNMLLSGDQKRFPEFSNSVLFASKDNNAWVTWWSLVHAGLTSIGGIIAYFIHKEEPWIGCLFLSFVVVGWEAFENTKLELKGKWFNNGKIDSDPNLLGDLIIGFTFLWGTAYIFAAANV